MASRTKALIVATLCLSVTMAPAFAARRKAKTPQVKVNPGVALYNEGKYREALPLLLNTIKANPEEPLFHYYLGCCYDRLHSEGSAMGQFLWVSKHSKDERLRSYAETALHGKSAVAATTEKETPTTTTPGSSTSDSNTSDSTTSASTASGAASSASETQRRNQDAITSSKLPYGKAKVIFFESANLESQQFESMFKFATRTYHAALYFETVDVSDPASRSLIAKYKVTTFPHLIYLDGKGNAIFSEGVKNFNLRLRELLGV